MITYLGSERYEFVVVFVIVLIEGSHVLAVTDQPIDRWEMFTLSQFLVQSPKHLKTKAQTK